MRRKKLVSSAVGKGSQGVGLRVVAILALTLAIVVVPIQPAAAQHGVVGSFQAGNLAPEVISVEMYQSDELTATTTLTPQDEFALKVGLGDGNTIDEITLVKVTLYHDSTYSSPPASGDVSGAAIYQWTKSGGAWVLGSPLGSTWTVVSGAGKSRAPADMTQTTGTWWLHFQPGKVAQEATGGNNNEWIAWVEVEDVDSATDSDGSVAGLSMAWYGELTSDATYFDFGAISPGATDQAIAQVDGSPASYINIIPTSNGNYALQTKADAVWTGTAVSLTLGTEFSLKVDEATKQDGSPQASAATLTGTYQTYATETGPTSEGSTTVPAYLWLTMPGGQVVPKETYTGTVYFEIVNN